MSEKCLGPLIGLVDRGLPSVAASEAKQQVDALLGFLSGLYHSGRIEDTDGSAIKYARMAATNLRTPRNFGNLVFLLNKAGSYDEAIDAFAEASLLPGPDEDVATLYYNYAVVLKENGQLEAAASAFRVARQKNPSCAMTHYQLADVLMALGEFREGLAEDQYRFQAHSQLRRFRQRFRAPDWDGKKAERVLVFSEQGLGDALHNARYLEGLRRHGCRAILEVQSELAGLFRGHPWVDEVHARQSADFCTEVVRAEAYDSVVSINSLPYHFDPGLDSPPVDQYLDPRVESPPLLEYRRPRVGLVWAGSRYHSNDRDRSCYLKHLLPLFDVPDISLLNFQQGDLVRTWCNGAGSLWDGDDQYEVVDLGEGAESALARMPWPVEPCRTFFDTALLLRQLDLLITVDTALVHLAGAMGVPTWLLLPQRHEWRWRRQWYTSVNYFKQDTQGDWAGLAGRVAEALTAWRRGLDFSGSPE